MNSFKPFVLTNVNFLFVSLVFLMKPIQVAVRVDTNDTVLISTFWISLNLMIERTVTAAVN